MSIYDNLNQLGTQTALPASPDEAVLEAVDNPHADVNYVTRFACPEFTSMCPITSQPDFAHLVIDYIADEKLLESKSLKLYLGSFRNHGDFHEACTVGIAKRIISTIEPKWLRISGYWYARGGISIDIFYQTGEPPKDVYIPNTDIAPLRGRG